MRGNEREITKIIAEARVIHNIERCIKIAFDLNISRVFTLLLFRVLFIISHLWSAEYWVETWMFVQSTRRSSSSSHWSRQPEGFMFMKHNSGKFNEVTKAFWQLCAIEMWLDGSAFRPVPGKKFWVVRRRRVFVCFRSSTEKNWKAIFGLWLKMEISHWHYWYSLSSRSLFSRITKALKISAAANL